MRKIIFLTTCFIFVHIICFGQNFFPQMSSQNERLFNDTFFFQNFDRELLLDTAFNRKICSFRNAWYSRHLKALEEPIIYSDTTGREFIRFTWLRTFDNPIVVRIENNNGVYFVYWKKSDGQGGFCPGKLVVDGKRQINVRQWNNIVNQLNRSNFWRLPTHNPFFGFDGAQWILEAKIDGKYHFIDRWTFPDRRIKQFCLSLLELTDLKIPENEIY